MNAPIRTARLAARVLHSNAGRLPFPYKLNYAVTDRCNSRCRTCNIWKKKAENELTLDEIRRFFARSNRFAWVDLTGGEIFLRHDIVDVCAAILRECRGLLLLHYPTNGLLTDRITAATREILALHPPRLVVTVSLDGPPQVNDDVRGVPGDWEKAVATFRALREIDGVEVFLGMTLSHLTYGRFPEAFESVRAVIPDLRHDEFHLNVMHTSSHYYANEDAPELDRQRVLDDLAAYREMRGGFRSVFGRLERAYQDAVPAYLCTGRSPLPCQSLSASCFLGPRGDVYPCAIWDRPLGNLRDHDYDLGRIWRLPSTFAARDDVRNDRCPGCWTPCEAYQTIAGNLFRRPRG